MPETCTRTPLGGTDPGGGAVEVRAGGDHAARHDAVGEDLPGVVDVGEERLQRVHPLLRRLRSIVDHVSVSITRGTMSSGNGRSSPPMSKVTPWSR